MSKYIFEDNENLRLVYESFNSAQELASVCDTRQITDFEFRDMKTHKYDLDFESVHNYEEAQNLLKNGHSGAVDTLKESNKISLKSGTSVKNNFERDVCGFSPIVSRTLMGVPKNMKRSKRVVIKNKVISVYFDITCNCYTKPKEMLKSGAELLGAILELEKQGYKINLYAIQNYCADCTRRIMHLLSVKIKDSNVPFNINRMSFPLTHPAFFRVYGFDWYSKVPNGYYLAGYGTSLAYNKNHTEFQDIIRKYVKDDNAIVLSNVHNLYTTKNEFIEMLKGEDKR